MYKIEVRYQSGNSFNTYIKEELLSPCWRHLDEAIKAMDDIQEHYSAYLDTRWSPDKGWSKYKKKSWMIRENDVDLPPAKYWHYDVRVKVGEEYQNIPVAWIGYFETLISIKVIVDGAERVITDGFY